MRSILYIAMKGIKEGGESHVASGKVGKTREARKVPPPVVMQDGKVWDMTLPGCSRIERHPDDRGNRCARRRLGCSSWP
jgi:hypothetical protein